MSSQEVTELAIHLQSPGKNDVKFSVAIAPLLLLTVKQSYY